MAEQTTEQILAGLDADLDRYGKQIQADIANPDRAAQYNIAKQLATLNRWLHGSQGTPAPTPAPTPAQEVNTTVPAPSHEPT